ncbi:uncharacterized protein LOC123450900 [Hordeum vulgare subsp. vulgare]|uniref:uncharacterized protein LOC123450900 n=1 Tax=Hordeum vulgare subsp. vulgare TaxID=112509 RepID=UPI001D1A3C71|nr:uncharacterized protein LOC123450900 [Hordeum vulgare subsp. vulgare]
MEDLPTIGMKSFTVSNDDIDSSRRGVVEDPPLPIASGLLKFDFVLMFLTPDKLGSWAFADSVLHRLAPLWIGARGLQFTWEYIFQGLEANANLVMTLSLAALGSLMWLRKNKPRTLIPIIYACALLLATMPSITRLSHYHAAVTLKGNNYHAPTYVDILISFF